MARRIYTKKFRVSMWACMSMLVSLSPAFSCSDITPSMVKEAFFSKAAETLEAVNVLCLNTSSRAECTRDVKEYTTNEWKAFVNAQSVGIVKILRSENYGEVSVCSLRLKIGFTARAPIVPSQRDPNVDIRAKLHAKTLPGLLGGANRISISGSEWVTVNNNEHLDDMGKIAQVEADVYTIANRFSMWMILNSRDPLGKAINANISERLDRHQGEKFFGDLKDYFEKIKFEQ